MPNAPAVTQYWEEFVRRHRATAPAKYRDDLILSGMTYNKGGYHSEIEWLRRNDPNDYSIQRAADRTSPGNYGAALDITFKSAQGGDYTMITHYMRLARAGITSPNVYYPGSNTNTFREMIGTLDGKSQHNVSFYKEAVLPNNDPNRTHMWHIHTSFTRKWLNDFSIYEPLLDMLFPTYTQEDDDMPLNADDKKWLSAEMAKQIRAAMTTRWIDMTSVADKYGYTKNEDGKALLAPYMLWSDGSWQTRADRAETKANGEATLAAVDAVDAEVADAVRQVIGEEIVDVQVTVRDEIQ